jgi:hypothetical protein
MRSAKLLMVLLSAGLFCGCAAMMNQSRMEYQDNRSVAAGQVVNEEKGLYHLAFPNDGYYLERSPYRIMFVPKDNRTSFQGPYVVKVIPASHLAKEYSRDLTKIFNLLMRKEMGRKAFRQAVMVEQDVRDFQGEAALYKEVFIPGSISSNMEGDRIKAPTRGCVGMVFFHNDMMYWLFHSEPIDEMVQEGKKITPRVEQKTIDQMESFINSFVFGPSK